MKGNNKFYKNEKLKSKKSIDLLFKSGKSFNESFFRILYQPYKSTALPKICISIPKKNIKLAVNRNLLKRRIRAAYRLNNNKLKLHCNNKKISINLMLIYTSKQILTYHNIEDKIKVILTRLIELSEVVDK
mgnify:CR=1 FL=1